MVTSSPSATAVAYVTDVRRTLAKRPDVYRQFVGVFRRRYDSDRNRLPNATELDDDKLADAVVDVVSLLRMHPRLVLGFNNFLPEGYRIKIRDSSSYVLEYSGGSGGGGKGDGVGSNAQRLVITI
jgi:histone deacetylase complex regulatory component SIN3